MKLLTLFFALVLSISSWGQIDQLNLKNALVVGQMDKSEDRFSVEINITECIETRQQCRIVDDGFYQSSSSFERI